MNSKFAEIDQLLQGDSIPAVLDFMVQQFLANHEYHRVFEVRKMQSRHALGLPIYYTDRPPSTTPEQNRALEQAVLAACREVGQRLVIAGQIQSAWYYLQPLDDPKFVRELLETAPVTPENTQEFLEVALYQGAYPELGYQMVLDRSGTCNAITTFESLQGYLALADRTRLATLLVQHLDRELRQNIQRALAEPTDRSELGADAVPNSQSPSSLPSISDFLCHSQSAILASMPHLDATHLASVVKIGRWTDQPEAWRCLIEFCDYGALLPESLQYPSDPPFTETYRDHRFYFQTLLQRDGELATELFAKKMSAASSPPEQKSIAAAWAELLYRIDRPTAAIEILLQAASADDANLNADLLNLASLAPTHVGLAKYFCEQDDLLSYGIVKLLERQRQANS